MEIRDYRQSDEDEWLRCRVLGFLDTCYFDDVKTAKTVGADHSLVAVADGRIVGLLDVTVDGDAATIDTVAVHPDHRRIGVAGRLLREAVRRVSRCRSLDAWTREDPAACGWYERNGFTEDFRYLHVYANGTAETGQDISVSSGLRAVTAFFHGSVADEEWLRARYRRVYVCRRYLRQLLGQVLVEFLWV